MKLSEILLKLEEALEIEIMESDKIRADMEGMRKSTKSQIASLIASARKVQNTFTHMWETPEHIQERCADLDKNLKTFIEEKQNELTGLRGEVTELLAAWRAGLARLQPKKQAEIQNEYKLFQDERERFKAYEKNVPSYQREYRSDPNRNQNFGEPPTELYARRYDNFQKRFIKFAENLDSLAGAIDAGVTPDFRLTSPKN